MDPADLLDRPPPTSRWSIALVDVTTGAALGGHAEDAMVRDWLGSGVDHSMVLAALSLDPLVHIDVTDEAPVCVQLGAVRGPVAEVLGAMRGVERWSAGSPGPGPDPAGACRLVTNHR